MAKNEKIKIGWKSFIVEAENPGNKSIIITVLAIIGMLFLALTLFHFTFYIFH